MHKNLILKFNKKNYGIFFICTYKFERYKIKINDVHV